MIHTQAKGPGQRSLCSKARVTDGGQTVRGDCITTRANAVGINSRTDREAFL